MQQFIRPVQIAPEAHLIQSFWHAPGAPVGVHFNTMVLAGREPVVFDTGLAADEQGWLDAVKAVVEPDDIRWIVLSHDDPDHTGNLQAAMVEFPNASVVASWWMTERMMGSVEIDPRRLRWLVSGDTLDIGDRTLIFQRPPLFDNPTTRVVFDPSTGLLWGGDLGAALAPEPVLSAEESDDDELAASFVPVHRLMSPWAAMVDEARYQSAVDQIARFDITTWANTHGPLYEGRFVGRAIELLRQVPSAPEPTEPNQADLDDIVSSMLAGV